MINALSQLSDLLGWWKSDVGLYDATTGGTDITGSTGSAVARWEDQSGNGYHLTANDADQRPDVASDGSLFFGNSSTESDSIGNSSLEYDRGGYTVVMLLKLGSTKAIAAESFADVFESTPIYLRMSTTTGNLRFSTTPPSIVVDTTVPARSDYAVLIIAGNESQTVVELGGVREIISGAFSTTVLGFQIGSASLTNAAIMQVKEAAIFDRVLAPAELRDVRSYFERQGIKKERSGILIVQGDDNSITRDNMLDGVSLYRSPKTYKLGRDGVTVETDLLSEAVTRIDPLYDSSEPRNIAVLIAGRADIEGGRTAAELFNDVKNWARLRKSAGFQTILTTLLPFGSDAGEETIRVAFNALLASDFDGVTSSPRVFEPKANNIYADLLVDLASDATIGAAGSQSNATYYETDLITLTPAGSAIAGTYLKYAVDRLFRRRNPSYVLAGEVVRSLNTWDLLVESTVQFSFDKVAIDDLKRQTENEVLIRVNPGDLETDRGARGLVDNSPEVVITVACKRSSLNQTDQPEFDDLFDLCNEIKLLLMENELPLSGQTATTATISLVYAPELQRESGVFCSQIVAQYPRYSQEVLR